MKAIKLVSLLRALLFVAACFVSCGGNFITAKVRLSVIKGNPDDDMSKKTLICPVMEADIKGDPPTVLQATREILEENSIKYTVDESIGGGHVTAIKGNKEESRNGVVTGWIFKLNGKDAPGLASETPVADGDYIVFYLTSWENDQAQDDVNDESGETETETETEEVTEAPEEDETEEENG